MPLPAKRTSPRFPLNKQSNNLGRKNNYLGVLHAAGGAGLKKNPRALQPLQSRRVALRDSSALEVQQREMRHCAGISELRRRLQPARLSFARSSSTASDRTAPAR